MIRRFLEWFLDLMSLPDDDPDGDAAQNAIDTETD